ncbi:hypothetical protein F2P56_024650 [Juglans regia]|uniref:DUF4218 domain-containing protein n=1 Tax=Juglans regia TaxID=51240 RepID=A0A833TT14_JUGRE|nr:hypothetical protein F2P56_024650 [Juglans regia]
METGDDILSFLFRCHGLPSYPFTREAILGDPVQYRWMYPFERYLGKFKQYVKNKVRPKGSIPEAYIHTECLTFCSMYLKDVETRFSSADRNIYVDEEETIDGFRIFNQKVRPLDIASNVQLEDKLSKAAIWYVLNNCAEIGPYIEEHYEKCKMQHPNCIDHTHQTEFPTWFKQREHRTSHPLNVSDDLYALACRPAHWVASYATCGPACWASNSFGLKFFLVAEESKKDAHCCFFHCHIPWLSDHIIGVALLISDFYFFIHLLKFISWDNKHYGTLENPAASGRLPGGSSSGAVVVANLVDFSLGVDTVGGSVDFVKYTDEEYEKSRDSAISMKSPPFSIKADM